jgi:hypothetical protein
MVTQWQARLALVGFLAIGAGIATNLLLLQERRTATASIKPQTPRAVPEAPVRARAVASQDPETKSPPAVSAPRIQPATASNGSASPRQSGRRKKARAQRRPAITASTR